MPASLPLMLARTAGAALAGGVVGTALVRALALRVGFVNHPNPLIPQHTRPVAYLGGAGIAIGIGAGLAAGAGAGGGLPGWALLAPAALFLALGVADDLMALAPASKFGLQALIAAFAVASGVRAPITGTGPLDAAISWLWLVTLVNAFNLTDVCDGLLASLAMVVFAALALLDRAHTGAALAIAAACLGFLFFNRPPARIFLGDAGSHLLGFLAAALSLQAVAGSSRPVPTLVAALLIAGVPLFELVFLVVVRSRRGVPWWKGSPDHFSLRLQAAGFTRGRTDLIACGVAGAWAAGGLALPERSPAQGAVLAALVVVSAGIGAVYLLRHPVKPHPRPGGAVASSEVAVSRGVPVTP
jgi:UDP-GlcNAc:undecaprenyl-phosphate GlcNAc-1-phosphate transferase